MLVFYIGPLFVLLLNSFFRLDDFTGQVVPEFNLGNYVALFQSGQSGDFWSHSTHGCAGHTRERHHRFPIGVLHDPLRNCAHQDHFVSGGLAAAVVKLPHPRICLEVDPGQRRHPHLGIRTAWIERVVDAVLGLPGIGGPSLSFSPIGVFVVFVYVWLPYMVLPIQAALERLPKSLLEASGDLGARPNATFRHVTLPLVIPGIVAGSIFTFSLTLGDFVVPAILGNSNYFIGQAVLSFQGSSGNVPLAAAFTVVPVVIMILYMLGAKRVGAFDAL